MNPHGNIATLKPFKPGHTASRRSRDVDRALREYRKLTPEAAKFVGKVLRDETEDTRLRLKAAEIIAQHGMPKGDAHKRALEAIDGGVNSLRVEFVSADGRTVSFEQANLPAIPSQPPTFDVPFIDASMDKAAVDHAITGNPAPVVPSTDE